VVIRTLTLVVVLAFARVAAADDELDKARSAVESSDYDAARAALDTALHAGDASPEDLAEIYKLTGIVQGALGDTDAATKAFAAWLELDPKGKLPDGTSPKIGRPFRTASDQAKKKKTAVDVKAVTATLPPTITLVVGNDPSHLISKARVIVVADGKAEQTIDGKPGVAIDLPHGGRLDVRALALDEQGNHVFEVGSKTVPLVITGAETDDERERRLARDVKVVKREERRAPVAPAKPRPWYFRWWAWGGAAVVMTATTAVFAYETHSDLDEIAQLNRNSLDHQWHDEQVVEERANRNLLIADIAAGATGVFALGATILYLTRPHVLESAPVAAVPMRGGGQIVIGGRF
jgi:hypothetical protein